MSLHMLVLDMTILLRKRMEIRMYEDYIVRCTVRVSEIIIARRSG